MIRALLLTTAMASSCAPTVPGLMPMPDAMTTNVHVTGTYPVSCHRTAVDDPRLPVRSCTPGTARTDITGPAQYSATICKPGWTATIRPPVAETDRVKTAAMLAYGIPSSQHGIVELDHLIPLELAGTNDVHNLWPEVSDEPGKGFRNTKDEVENRLRRAVCAGRVTLPAAQHAIAGNWTAAEAKLGLG